MPCQVEEFCRPALVLSIKGPSDLLLSEGLGFLNAAHFSQSAVIWTIPAAEQCKQAVGDTSGAPSACISSAAASGATAAPPLPLLPLLPLLPTSRSFCFRRALLPSLPSNMAGELVGSAPRIKYKEQRTGQLELPQPVPQGLVQLAALMSMLEACGMIPVLDDGLVGGNCAITCSTGGGQLLYDGEWDSSSAAEGGFMGGILISRSGKQPGAALQAADWVLLTHFDATTWRAEFWSAGEGIRPSSDAPLHAAALAPGSAQRYAWGAQPLVAVHGHALAEGAGGLPLPASSSLSPACRFCARPQSRRGTRCRWPCRAANRSMQPPGWPWVTCTASRPAQLGPTQHWTAPRSAHSRALAAGAQPWSALAGRACPSATARRSSPRSRTCRPSRRSSGGQGGGADGPPPGTGPAPYSCATWKRRQLIPLPGCKHDTCAALLPGATHLLAAVVRHPRRSHPYPQHRCYIRRGHGFLLLAQSVRDAGAYLEQHVLPLALPAR